MVEVMELLYILSLFIFCREMSNEERNGLAGIGKGDVGSG